MYIDYGGCMSNLFILGNGFDIAHGLPTGYKYFKVFLYNKAFLTNYKEFDELPKVKSMPQMPSPQIYYNGSKVYNKLGECRLLYWMIEQITHKDIEWRKFEKLLVKLNYDKLKRITKDKEYFGITMLGMLETLDEVFFEWIGTIKVTEENRPKLFLKNTINDDDLAISFNYTNTLEKIYGFNEKNICHIHGKYKIDTGVEGKRKPHIWGENNQKLVMGYSENNFWLKAKRKKHQYFDRSLLTLYGYFLKDCEQIIEYHKNFYDKVENSNVNKIYSFGFSYGKVDAPQIKALCDSLNKIEGGSSDMVWYLNKFDDKFLKNYRFKRFIKKCGFKGSFAKYDAKETI